VFHLDRADNEDVLDFSPIGGSAVNFADITINPSGSLSNGEVTLVDDVDFDDLGDLTTTQLVNILNGDAGSIGALDSGPDADSAATTSTQYVMLVQNAQDESEHRVFTLSADANNGGDFSSATDHGILDLGDDFGGTTPGGGGDTTDPTLGDDPGLSVAEDAANGTVVGSVSATDNVGVTGFSITAGNTDVDNDGTDAFAIDSNGQITVADTDDLVADGSSDPFSLTIQASDAAGNTGDGSFSVDVTAAGTGGGNTQPVDSGNDGQSFTGTGDTTFDFSEAGYAVSVDSFASGDVLDFADVGGGTTATFNVLTDSDQADGEQQLQVTDPNSGNDITVTLTGLSNAQDSGVFNQPSFESTFGSDALVL
jgi:hypothetical protein